MRGSDHVAIIATLIGTALLVVAWWAGPRLAADNRRFTITAASCLVVIIGWFAVYDLTYAALQVIPWHDALFFERIPLYVAIILLLSTSVRRLASRHARTGVAAIMTLFFLYAVAEIAVPIALPLFADQLSERTEGPAEVTQSTGWSCGGAALAWAARLHGIAASERQMVRLAVTTPLRGTSTRGMLRALDRIGLDARPVKPASWDELVAAPKPALIGWKLSATVAHAALVLEIDGDGDRVNVGDPLQGRMTYSREEFTDRWLRDMIVIESPQGTAAPR